MTIENSASASEPTSSIDCQVITPKHSEAWNEAIDAVSPESRFLCSDWTMLLQHTYGYAPHLVVLKENGKVAAVMPFVVVKSILTGTRAISLPFFDICKAYSPNEQHITQLYETFKTHGKQKGWDYLELRGDIRKLNISEPSLSFYNHVVDLSGGPDAVFSNLASSTRRAVRKAEKIGVQIEFSNTLDALKGFYELQFITRKRHGLPPQPFSFFKNIHQALIKTGRGQIVSAQFEGQLAASGIYLEQGNFCHYKYGASDTKFQEARCNNYVMWSAMKYFSERGFKAMDLGRNSLENDSLRKYKQTYGPTEQLTYYHRYDLKKDQIMKMTDDVYGWHNKIFAILPKPLSQLTGALLYKHIA